MPHRLAFSSQPWRDGTCDRRSTENLPSPKIRVKWPCLVLVRSVFLPRATLVLMSLMIQGVMTLSVKAQDSNYISSGGLGSADEYVREKNPGLIQEVPELGVTVRNGTARLEGGVELRGAEVIRVIPDGPAAVAGLSGEQRNLGKAIVTGAFIAGGLVFPPALLGALVLGESDIGESHETIVAVDSERTRDVEELERAIGKGHEGPILYLSVVRRGLRKQTRVFVHETSQ